MVTLVLRETGASPKGSPLTNAEVDNNFQTLATAADDAAASIIELTQDVATAQATADAAHVKLVAGANITIDETDPANPVISASGGVQTVAGIQPVGGDILAPTLTAALGIDDKVDKVSGKQLSTEDYTTAEKNKLAGVAAGATANATNATLLARENHTGVQAVSTISGLQTELNNKQATLLSGTNIKTINGVTLLGSGDIVVGGSGGGGGLTLFEESRSVASPNATVPVHALTALGAETNIDFVVSPKGTGAFSLHVPDNTAAGGNKRGAGAVDLQGERGTPTQVASGSNAIVPGGAYNLASGEASMAAGRSNTSSGESAISLGRQCVSSGIRAISAGWLNVASGDYSFASGKYTDTRGISGAFAQGSGYSVGGKGQVETFTLSSNHNTAASRTLTTTGTIADVTNTPVIPNNMAYLCRIRVVVYKSSVGVRSWVGTALIKRGANAASTTMVGSTLTPEFGDVHALLNGLNVTLVANTSTGALNINVFGVEGEYYRWLAHLETLEVSP